MNNYNFSHRSNLYLLLGGIVVVCIFVGLVYVLMPANQQVQYADKGELIRLSGDADVDTPSSEKKYQDKVVELKQLVPLETETFTLEFDYSRDTFVVSFRNENGSQTAFAEWKDQNGFELIPDDKFYFVQAE